VNPERGATEDAEQGHGLDVETRLLPELAHDGVARALVGVDRAARRHPQARVRVPREEHAARVVEHEPGGGGGEEEVVPDLRAHAPEVVGDRHRRQLRETKYTAPHMQRAAHRKSSFTGWRM